MINLILRLGYECPQETPVILNPRRCNLGYYSGYGAAACIKCPEGWSCSNPAQIPVPCALGKYAKAGSTACSDCPDGTVCPGGKIKLCTPGQTCKASDDYPEPIECPAGKRCPDGKTKSDCPTGSYSLAGSSFCTICPKGKACPHLRGGPGPPRMKAC